MPTMAHGRLDLGGRCLLLVIHGREPPTGPEWDAWLDVLRADAAERSGDFSRSSNLVLSDGGGPSTAQRTEVNNIVAVAKVEPRVALVTESVVVRTLARGLSLFNSSFAVFEPASFRRAVSHVGLGGHEAAVLDALRTLEAKAFGAGASRTLAAIR